MKEIKPILLFALVYFILSIMTAAEAFQLRISEMDLSQDYSISNNIDYSSCQYDACLFLPGDADTPTISQPQTQLTSMLLLEDISVSSTELRDFEKSMQVDGLDSLSRTKLTIAEQINQFEAIYQQFYRPIEFNKPAVSVSTAAKASN